MASKEYMRNWYLKNRERNLEKAKIYRQSYPGAQRMREKRLRGQTFINEAKNKPCMDCGVRYASWIMQFDHRDPTQKRFTISSSTSRSFVDLQIEMDKCDVVCANCHAERTHKLGKLFRPGRPVAERKYTKRSPK